MATNPIFSEEPAPNWPSRSGAMSEEEFHELEHLNPDRKYEYIAGKVYMMSGGSVGHDLIMDNIRASLRSRLRSSSCTAFGSEVQVLIGIKKDGRKHFVYPDATVSCNVTDRRADNTLIESPKIVIEVLSPGTEARDRGVKFRIYQKCPTIQEIVLVNQYIPYVEIWQRDSQDIEKWNYRHYSAGDTVEFASIHVHVDIEELYLDLQFPVDDDEEE